MKDKPLILFATSELTPWIKTGGLADVSGSLPHALQREGCDVKFVLPAYHSVLEQLERPSFIGQLQLPLGIATIVSAPLQDTEVLLVVHPSISERVGNPYMADHDTPWDDNPFRFSLFSQAVTSLAQGECKTLDWQPDIVHCNDWQTGLVPALLHLQSAPPVSVFTIHNLAYQGNMPVQTYMELGLPPELFHQEGLEFWGQASFMKAGIVYSDRVNTVSPGYAEEITTPQFGNGMEGILQHHSHKLSGIINGIDDEDWNPQTDPHLHSNYSLKTLKRKAANKQALQQRFGLKTEADTPLLGVVSRLAVQKGIDLVIDAVRELQDENFQLVVLGSGETSLQQQLHQLADDLPGRVGVEFGYDEALSRMIEAGSDSFLMPSRYEPCGLNQMYSLRYGTPPLVTRVGGLADVVIDSKQAQGNGFVIDAATSSHLQQGIRRLLESYADKKRWKQLQHKGMSGSYGWDRSARLYLDLYLDALA